MIDHFRKKLKRWGLLPAIPVDFIRPADQPHQVVESSSNTAATVTTDTTTTAIVVPASGTWLFFLHAVCLAKVSITGGAGTSDVTCDIYSKIGAAAFTHFKGGRKRLVISGDDASVAEDDFGPITIVTSHVATNGETYQFQLVPTLTAGTLDADVTLGIRRHHSLEVELKRTA